MTAGLTFKEERSKQNLKDQNQELNKLNQGSNIIRDGQECRADCNIGDIVIIRSGDKVPGDCLLIEGENVRTDESEFTGESDHMDKYTYDECLQKFKLKQNDDHSSMFDSHYNPMLYGQSQVVNGQGKILILAIGRLSVSGKFVENLIENSDEDQSCTGLMRIITSVASTYQKRMLFLTFAVAAIMFSRYLGNPGPFIDGIQRPVFIINGIVEIIQVIVSLMTLASTSNYSLAIILTVSHSVKRLMLDNVLVRKLSIIEDLAYMDTLLVDGHKVLTTGDLAVEYIWSGELVNVSQPFRNFLDFIPENSQKHFEMAVLGSNYREIAQDQEPKLTNKAVIKYLWRCGLGIKEVNQKYELLDYTLFTTQTKSESVILKDTDGSIITVTKGAVEQIIDRCTEILDFRTGERQPANENSKDKLRQAADELANSGHRLIGYSIQEEGKDGPCFVTMTSTACELVPGIKATVSDFRRAGIEVKLITGDSLISAKKIATECGVLIEEGVANSQVIEGSDMQKMNFSSRPWRRLDTRESFDAESKDEISLTSESVAVISRAAPRVTEEYITKLQNSGKHVGGFGNTMLVACSKIGFAQAIGGDEIEKASSAAIIMDDSLKSVYQSIKYGRHLHKSVQDFLMVLLTHTIVTASTILITSLLHMEPVITTAQLMLANICVFGATVMITFKRDLTTMKIGDQPVRNEDALLTKKMRRHIVIHSAIGTFVLLVFIYFGTYFLPDPITKYPNHTVMGNDAWWVMPAMFQMNKGIRNWPLPNSMLQSRHYTYIFAVYLLTQGALVLVNLSSINSRGLITRKAIIWTMAAFLAIDWSCTKICYRLLRIDYQGLPVTGWLICVFVACLIISRTFYRA